MPGHCISTTNEVGVVTSTCHKGMDDLLFVFFMFNVVSVLRVAYRTFVLKPVTRYLKFKAGLASKFLESGWFALYFIVIFAWGISAFKDAEWFFNTKYFWIGYPHVMSYQTKLYYLSELAFWVQSLFVFIFEVPRKDRTAYLIHHCVTVSLISSSYYFNFTRIGAAILMMTNVGDIFYWNSKILKYARFEKTSTVSWLSFVFVWIASRHVIFGFILYSLWFEVPVYLDLDAYNPAVGFYASRPVWGFFSVLLLVLKVLMFYWLAMILKVVWTFIRGSEIKDTTDVSDDEIASPEPKSETRPPISLAKLEPLSLETDDMFDSQGNRKFKSA